MAQLMEKRKATQRALEYGSTHQEIHSSPLSKVFTKMSWGAPVEGYY
jgi:hypothetical protein